MKLGLFGWPNKRLGQTRHDIDFIEKKKFDFVNSEDFPCLFGFYFFTAKIAWEFISMPTMTVGGQRAGDTMRGLSMRFVWFDLVKSLVTFDTPVLYIAKRGVLVVSPECEYDPETKRHDAVSSKKKRRIHLNVKTEQLPSLSRSPLVSLLSSSFCHRC